MFDKFNDIGKKLEAIRNALTGEMIPEGISKLKNLSSQGVFTYAVYIHLHKINLISFVLIPS